MDALHKRLQGEARIAKSKMDALHKRLQVEGRITVSRMKASFPCQSARPLS